MRFLDIFNLSELFYKKASDSDDWKSKFVPPPSKAIALIRAGFFDNKGKFDFDEIKVQQNSSEIKNIIRSAIKDDEENFKKALSGGESLSAEKQEFANQKLNELVVNYVDNVLNNINHLNKMRSGLYYINNVIKLEKNEDYWLNNCIKLGNKLLNDLDSITLQGQRKAEIKGSILSIIDEAQKGSTEESSNENRNITISISRDDSDRAVKSDFNKNAKALLRLAKAKSFKLQIRYPFIDELHEAVNSITSLIYRGHEKRAEVVTKQSKLSHIINSFKEDLSKTNLSDLTAVSELKENFKKTFNEKASEIFNFIDLNKMVSLEEEGKFNLIKEKILDIENILKNATIQETIKQDSSDIEEAKKTLDIANAEVSKILHGATTSTASKLKESLLQMADSFDKEKPTQEQIEAFENINFPDTLKSKESKIKELIKRLDYKTISYINYLAEELKKVNITKSSTIKDNLISFILKLNNIALAPKANTIDFKEIEYFLKSLNNDLTDFNESFLNMINQLIGDKAKGDCQKVSKPLISAIRSLLAGAPVNVEDGLNKYLEISETKSQGATSPLPEGSVVKSRGKKDPTAIGAEKKDQNTPPSTASNPQNAPPAADPQGGSGGSQPPSGNGSADPNSPPGAPNAPSGSGTNTPDDERKKFFEKISTDIEDQISAFASLRGKPIILKSNIAPKFIEKIKQVIAAISEGRSTTESRQKLSNLIDTFISIISSKKISITNEHEDLFNQDIITKTASLKEELIEALKKIKSLLQLSDDQLRTVKGQETFDAAITASQGSGSPKTTDQPDSQKKTESKPNESKSSEKSSDKSSSNDGKIFWRDIAEEVNEKILNLKTNKEFKEKIAPKFAAYLKSSLEKIADESITIDNLQKLLPMIVKFIEIINNKYSFNEGDVSVFSDIKTAAAKTSKIQELISILEKIYNIIYDLTSNFDEDSSNDIKSLIKNLLLINKENFEKIKKNERAARNKNDDESDELEKDKLKSSLSEEENNLQLNVSKLIAERDSLRRELSFLEDGDPKKSEIRKKLKIINKKIKSLETPEQKKARDDDARERYLSGRKKKLKQPEKVDDSVEESTDPNIQKIKDEFNVFYEKLPELFKAPQGIVSSSKIIIDAVIDIDSISPNKNKIHLLINKINKMPTGHGSTALKPLIKILQDLLKLKKKHNP